MSTLSDDEAIARLQQDFLSTISSVVEKPNSVVKKPKLLRKNIRRLETYLNNPHLEVNFEIDGFSPLEKATSRWWVLEKLLELESLDLNFRTPDGRTSIFSAIESPQTDSLKLLLQKGAAVDVVDNKGRTAISVAAEYGRIDHMKHLVQSNANINVKDVNGWTPISFAISRSQNDSNDSTKYLLSQKDIHLSNHDTDGRTLAVIAAQGENIEGLRLLLDANITVTPMDRIEHSPLLWAILQMDTITARLILRADRSLVDYKVQGRTPLSIATEIGDIDMIKLLVELGANVNLADDFVWPSLRDFSFKSYFPSDEFLREVDCFVKGARCGTNCRKPLLVAAEFQHSEVLNLLLEAKADINTRDAEGRTALTWAISRKLEKTVELLLSNPEIDINCRDMNGQSPFALAAGMGNVCMLEKLLKQGPDVNSEDDNQKTPLLLAATNRCLEAVEFLLKIPEIDVDHVDDHGRTPFSFAAEKDSLPIMQALLNKQADPHRLDNRGCTSFWWLLQTRHAWLSSPQPPNVADWDPSSLQALICALPTPYKKDPSGRDWLSWAASYGDEEIVRCLLQCGEEVNVNARDDTRETFSKTPLIWALEGEHDSVIDLLKDGDNISLHLLVEGIRSASKEYCLRLMRALLQAGYNLNQTDMNGRTPLHSACRTDDKEIVSILINANAKLSCKDHTGNTPLQIALHAKSKIVVDTLLKAPSVDLNPVRSEEWFSLGKRRAAWAQVTKKIGNEGFELKLENDIACVFLPCAREIRLR
jgi:ankyrin repeat protein